MKLPSENQRPLDGKSGVPSTEIGMSREHLPPGQRSGSPSTERDVDAAKVLFDHTLPISSSDVSSPAGALPSGNSSPTASRQLAIPAFERTGELTAASDSVRFAEACAAWLMRSPSLETRSAYQRELRQFLRFAGISEDRLEALAAIRPHQVAAWRDILRERGLSNAGILRKITVLRSLFSYLQVYGYTGGNPAHSDFVQTPSVGKDGKTVGLAPEDCRRLLDAPELSTPVGVRDAAMLAVLAYTGCRVGELTRLRVSDYKMSGTHRVLEIRGKGGKERRVPLHPEAVERIEAWLEAEKIRDAGAAPLFRAQKTARGKGRDGFHGRPFTRRAVQHLIARYVRILKLDPAVTVHSLRVTALTTARERGADIIDLQDFAGHSDPRTTLTYIRTRDRLSKSPAYVLRY